MELEEPKIIHFPKISDPRGNLSFLESNTHFPFKLKRTYWTYDVPGGQIRGGHAYFKQEEVIIALSGSFDVVVNNGSRDHIFHLNRSYFGLYVPKLTWRHIENFATNTVCLTLASTHFSPSDYIREFEIFKKLANEKSEL